MADLRQVMRAQGRAWDTSEGHKGGYFRGRGGPPFYFWLDEALITVLLRACGVTSGQHTENSEVNDFKTQELPLARIKKIMKLDEDVKMISAEAPVLFAKAAEIFISELSLRAWVHTEDNKRRTLQRNDIAMAITKFDQFDFLIDIVPRDDIKPAKRAEDTQRAGVLPDQVQYYFQIAQQHQAALQQQNTTQSTTTQQVQVQNQQVVQQPFQIQIGGQTQTVTVNNGNGETTGTPQVIQIQAPAVQQQQHQQQQQQQQQSVQQQSTAQVFQQIVTPNGELQNIPIQLNASQLQSIQLQMQGRGTNQPIVIQTAAQQGQIQQTTDQTFTQMQTIQVPMGQLSGAQQVFIQSPTDEEPTADQQDGAT
ncbi:nuclear transcription factor Y subunit gamma-like isoform X2 [Tubulanus polymorphus]|uniref:nuclear transcription factor Y subunit gamma-like isoform X2 n=1 Tax=Tubulanus polymorphus TaxID=672921 RepID=UPI003DA23EFD